MKYYKLLTTTHHFFRGDLFTFKSKHLLLAHVTFSEQRQILWEDVIVPAESLKDYRVIHVEDVEAAFDGKKREESQPQDKTKLH